MDPNHYGRQQGWDTNSAPEGYGSAHEPRFRSSSFGAEGLYEDRRFLDDRFSAVGFWPPSRRRSYEEEYPQKRESSRHEKLYIDSHNEIGAFDGHISPHDYDKYEDRYLESYSIADHGFDRSSNFGGRDYSESAYDDRHHRARSSHQQRDDYGEGDYILGRHSYDSDFDRREGNYRRRDHHEREHDRRSLRNRSPYGRNSGSRSRSRSRSHSHGHDDHHKMRSSRSRSRSHTYREDSYDDDIPDRSNKLRDREERFRHEHYSMGLPSSTVVVKGLSQKTTEEELHQILAEWGPLRNVRVIRERQSGLSRGFAFVDFPSTGAAQSLMKKMGDDGLVVDGRKLFFEYSSKPTGGSGSSYQDNVVRSGHGNHRNLMVSSDWMCTICGCINFARRTSCFQCNEPRTDDAPAADIMSSSQSITGKKGSDTGPTHVLVVRGLDENADEEMLRYEFSKHAPIKDLRLVRDKFTHVSRGFAFVHFYSVEDATKCLEATNGMALEKNGQIIRVAYAKSTLGPGSSSSALQSSSLAAAAIEAATFAQQYDAVGWAPKEYNPEEKQSSGRQEPADGDVPVQNDGSSLQSSFVWDQTSGYYYDAGSGFYYDGTSGLYYDGNGGIWYSFDHNTQQYIPCTDQNTSRSVKDGKESEPSKGLDCCSSKKVVISAPAATISSVGKAASLPDAVQAAAAAALAAEKKEKEKLKEIKLASKSSIIASKKKMSNVLTMWKQRSHEGHSTRGSLEDSLTSIAVDDRSSNTGQVIKSKLRTEVAVTPDASAFGSAIVTVPSTVSSFDLEHQAKARPVSNSSGGAIVGVIRGSGRGSSVESADVSVGSTAFKTDASALGSYSSPVAPGSGKRRFSEIPSNSVKELPQAMYRDRAAERRNLYGSSSMGNDIADPDLANLNRDMSLKKSSMDSMPFPPGVGGSRGSGEANANSQSYEVITTDKAIDESNVGNRMLRSMGWHEGVGLGKDGSGMVEPVQARGMESRAGLGSQPKKLDPDLEVQAGDSYRTLMHKKALSRFREMS